VEQNLLKLNRVAGDRGQSPRKFNINGHVLIDQIAMDQLQDILHDFVDTERMLSHLAFFQPQAQATDDFAGALVFTYDLIKNFLDLGEVGAAVRKDTLRSLRVAEYGGERQAKLVRKRARKFAQRENAREVRHFVAVTRRLLF